MSTLSQQWFARLSLLAVLSASPLVAASLHTPSVRAQSPQPSVLVGQRSGFQRLRFTPGTDSAMIKSSVVNGSRDRYLLSAKKGQTMTIRITSLENNAVFDVVAPPNGAGQRRTLKQEAANWSSTLPETGDYQIVIGSTRGNANYRLQVTIK